MIVKGTHLKYSLYIEGVRVPISSLSISNTTFEGATLEVDVLPIPEALLFTKGMKVHLFRQENTDEPELKFNGLLKNNVYVKNTRGRSIRFHVGSMDCRWETMLMAEFSPRNLSAAVTAKNIRDNPNIPEELKTAREELKDAARKSNEYLNAGKLDNLSEAIPQISGASLPTIGPGSGIYGEVTQNLDSEIKKSTADGADIQEWRDISSLKDRFDVQIEMSGGDVIAGILEMIRVAYRTSNPYNRREYSHVGIEKMITELFPTLMSGDSPLLNIDYGKLKVKSSEDAETITSPEYLKNSAFRGGILALLRNILSSSSISVPVKTIITQLLDGVFYRLSVDPSKIDDGLVAHPIMNSYIPPRCNVIFPHEYDTVTVNTRLWDQPTRSIISFPIFSDVANGVIHSNGNEPTYNTCLVPIDDEVLAKVRETTTIEADVNSDEGYKKLLANAKLISDSLTDAETIVGITPNIQHIMNPMLASLDTPTAYKVADFFHQTAKQSVRTAMVMGAEMKRLMVGMPIVVLDGNFTLHGVLERAVETVDASGTLSTHLEISGAKYILVEDLPTPALWLDADATSYDKIGEYYRKILGCDSVFDSNVALEEAKTDSQVLRKCIINLISKYWGDKDRITFANNYKKRTDTLTMTAVFKDKYKCASVGLPDIPETADEVSKSVIWNGPIFDVYNKLVDDSPSFSHTVDKQKIVVDYLRKYYNSPAMIVE